MCTNSGVAMYEWNTFRNLLKGKMSFFKKNQYDYCYNNPPKDLSNILETQEYLIKNIEEYISRLTKTNYSSLERDLLSKTRVLFRYHTAIYCMDKPIFHFGSKSWDIPLVI